MINPRFSALMFTAVLLAAAPATGDQEASNRPHVVASSFGSYYAKSVPAQHLGEHGQTSVYLVREGADQLLHTFPWFSSRIYLDGSPGIEVVYLVRMGPWARGHEARADQLAFAIYKNGNLVRSVSSADLVRLGAKLRSSVSHYTLIHRVVGLRRPWGNQLLFEVELGADRRLVFDVDTGEVVTAAEEALAGSLYAARTSISRLKSRWSHERREIEGIRKHLITEDDLRSVGEFPELPAGYVYVPGRVFDPVELEVRPPTRPAKLFTK